MSDSLRSESYENRRQKILVIDDDTNFVLGICGVLRKADFQVITAGDGPNGITKAQQEQPDLILLDVNMGQMDGFEVKQILKYIPRTRNIPVIFLTAMNERSHILNGLSLAEGYLQKPIEGDILVARIRAVMRSIAIGYKHAVLDSKSELVTNEGFRSWGQAVEIHDTGTGGHTQRVMCWYLALAKRCGISGKLLDDGRKGALLHDIGKLAIPEDILNKPGPLDEEEWKIVRQHPEFANLMLSPVEKFHDVMDIPRYHHERWDGYGYPHGLKGEDIPINARIFSVVDIFDALISRRPYKQGLSEEEALEMIRKQRGKQLDPMIVDYFLHHFQDIKNEAQHECNETNSSY